MSNSTPRVRLRIWDLPTRLFHWALAACVIGLIVTGKIGGAAIQWHALLGQAVLALLMFRLVWGLMGGHWSRFVHFVPSAARLADYLRGHSHHGVGHNPLGALAVLAMLAVLFAQVGSGLISDDEIAFTGPLNAWVSNATALAATRYHRSLGQWLLIALVVLHLCAIAWHQWRRGEPLVQAMVHGDRPLAPNTAGQPPLPASRDSARTRVAALLWFALSVGAVMLLATLAA